MYALTLASPVLERKFPVEPLRSSPPCGSRSPLYDNRGNPFRYFNSSPEVIRLVVMMYVRYPLSLRNVEDLLAERGTTQL